MKTFFNGFETNEATFKSNPALNANRAVALTISGKVDYPDEGGEITGILTSYRDGIASVVMKGYAMASFNETVPQVGICKLAPGKKGFMEVDEENGKAYTVLSVDINSKTIEFIL